MYHIYYTEQAIDSSITYPMGPTRYLAQNPTPTSTVRAGIFTPPGQ